MLGLPGNAWVLFLRGILVTLELTGVAGVIGLLTAFAAGLAQISRRRTVRLLATIYIEFWRGASALVQLFVAFYVLPLFGLTLPPFTVGALILGLNVGAYGSQIVRGAVQAIDQGQHEAAAALGLRPWQTGRLVIIPQALPAMLPAFGNEAVELLKLTAIVSLITLQDLSFVARMVVQRDGHTTLVYALELGFYFLLASPLLWLVRRAERRARGPSLPATLP